MNWRAGIIVTAILGCAVGAGVAYRYGFADGWAPRTTGLTLYGNVDIRDLDLSFRQAGRLARMLVEEGDKVQAGQVLAELDAQPYRDALSIAEAQLKQAIAQRDKARNGPRPQEIAQAEDLVRQAEATLRNAEAQLARRQSLAGTGAGSLSSLDEARAARDSASAGLAASRQALSLLREGTRLEDRAVAEAGVLAAEAAVAQARTSLADTRLITPSDGVVLSRVREAGSMVAVRDPVYVLSLLDPVVVRAYIPEASLGRAVPGAKVTLRRDGAERLYHGQIGFVSPRAEFTPKSVETASLRTDLVYRLRIIVEDADDGLRQGMPVTVKLAEP